MRVFAHSFGKVFLVRPILAPADTVYAMKVLRKTEVVKRHQVRCRMLLLYAYCWCCSG
jgi:hypothetical protein